jgi:4-amino-4-deoxy-L-arabinose transferase-like glycosyltransferase
MGEVLKVNSSFLRISVFFILLQCAGIADHSLWTPDEPREAEIIREMSLQGEYFIPHLAGEAYLEKPPLYYMVGVACYSLLGGLFQESGRVASLLFGLCALVVVYFFARRIYGDEEAVLAPLILATFPLFYLASHKILVDMGLLFFITVGMSAFFEGYRKKRGGWYVLFWLSLACAFLCKGMVGLAIPGMSLLIFAVWQRDASFLRQKWFISGVLFFLGAVAAWSGVLYARGGQGYLYTFFVYNQIGRFIPGRSIYGGGHERSFYYYLLNVPVLTAPFSLLLIPAASESRGLSGRERFLYSWILGGLIILSLSSTKRGIYFLPMLPAMAMIIAHWAARLGERGTGAWQGFFLKAVILAILTVAVILPAVYVKQGGSAATALLVSGTFLCLFVLLWRRCRGSLPLLAVLSWSLVFILWTPAVFPLIDKGKGYREIFKDMGRIVSHRQVVGYDLTETVEALGPFYGHFPVKNVEDRAVFINILDKSETEYIIMLPGRVDEALKKELEAHARLVYQSGGEMRREMELWKIRSSR